ncbi:MAG: PEP-CTERM sorting domain-containing protein, partial [Oxalobacteraceae bacterium]
VYGMSLGVGSGFNNGIFSGAEDNVSIAFSSGVNRSFNFEVAPGATDVPEPATMTLTLAGLGALALMRRRKA